MKVLSVFGTRPEAIKLAPVIKQLEANPMVFSCTCVTAQHREMLDQVLALFSIHPDYDLDIMRKNQELTYITSQVLTKVEQIIEKESPDWVLVQGDTTTVMATALAAFYRHVPVGHVEAGLRTGNKQQPFPEEINRRITDVIADLYFAPTDVAKENLLDEGVPEDLILVTGNTIVDALMYVLSVCDTAQNVNPVADLSPDERLVLVTAHRRENHGQPLERICRALCRIALEHYPSLRILYAVHPNPQVQETVYRMLDGTPGIQLTGPLDYSTFVKTMSRAYLILTDSGGIQEEATALGKPVLVLRECTERVEALRIGTAQLVGTKEQVIIDAVNKILSDPDQYEKRGHSSQVYGDGYASQRIVQGLLQGRQGHD